MRVLIYLAAAGLLAGCDDLTTKPDPPAPSDPPVPPLEVAGLWTASGAPGALLRFSAHELGETGAHQPATTLTTTSAPLMTLAAVGFDRRGDLWVASSDGNLLLRFAAGPLAATGTQPAATVITPNGGSLSQPLGLAFDHTGRLWIANHGNGTLAGFDEAQLAAGGAPAPAVVVSGAGNPVGLAFDAQGGLWVSDNVAQTISRYPPEQLVRSGTPRPTVVLTERSTPLALPLGLAFDREGTLWVANLGSRTVVAFGPAELATTGSPAPRVVLTSVAASLSLPVGLVFDSDGDLWVVGATGSLSEFARERLAAGGVVEPRVRLEVTGHSLLWTAAFWPSAAGLPLNQVTAHVERAQSLSR